MGFLDWDLVVDFTAAETPGPEREIWKSCIEGSGFGLRHQVTAGISFLELDCGTALGNFVNFFLPQFPCCHR